MPQVKMEVSETKSPLGRMAAVKVEIDVAEETFSSWLTENRADLQSVSLTSGCSVSSDFTKEKQDTQPVSSSHTDDVTMKVERTEEGPALHIVTEVKEELDWTRSADSEMATEPEKWNDNARAVIKMEISSFPNVRAPGDIPCSADQEGLQNLHVQQSIPADMECMEAVRKISSPGKSNKDSEIAENEPDIITTDSQQHIAQRQPQQEPGVSKPHACDKCKATFAQPSNLKRHKMTHTKEKPYPCDLCSALFTQSCNLKRHMLTHTGERPYSCNQCAARFSDSGKLKKHKLTHTGERPYSCDQCQARFTESGSLKRHKVTHTGERLHSCDQCKAAFPRTWDLKKHMRIHTGEKPYTCGFCDALFTESGNLKCHMQIHAAETIQLRIL